VVLYIFLILAATEFVVRVPVRYLQPTNWSDLAQNYAASRIWLRGQNFADPQNFVALWRDEVHSTLDVNSGRVHLAPPPGSLVLYAPIGMLPWPAAKLVWFLVLLASFTLTVWALIKTAQLHIADPRTLAFIAGCLALAPFHTGIAAENQTILVVALCALGIYAASRDRDVAAGLLFGAACSLKPHIGTFIVLYYLIQRRWRLFATAVGFTAVLVLIAIGWMQISGVAWASDYFHNIKVLTVENRIDDFTSANPIRFLLINLQVPFYSFTRQATSANLLALVTGAVLICVWMYLVLRVGSLRRRDFELLSLAAIAIIGLLPVYHRLYDASLLAIPLCWCLSRPPGRSRSVSTAALILMLPFALPTTAILQQLVMSHRISDSLVQSWAWERIIMPHESYLLLALAIVLLRGIALIRADDEESRVVNDSVTVA
jgi:hypothetical protein